MTYPSANPGGEHNWLVRNTLKEWIDAQHIDGLTEVFLTLSPVRDFDSVETNDADCAALVYINMGTDRENRAALTGPSDPGGKEINYDVELRIIHKGSDPDDWETSQRDYNRLVDKLKDCLRAEGRDLGRPDVILQAGDWPAEGGLEHQPADPVNNEENGTVDRLGVIRFVVSQYLPTFVPAAPA